MNLFGRRAAWSRPTDVEEVLTHLRETSLFASEDDEQLQGLALHIEVRTAPTGEVIIREGRLPSHLYLVCSGRLDVLSSGETDGAPKKVNELAHPDHFGEIGLLEGMPSTATVRVASEAVLYRLRAEVFLAFVRDSPLGSRLLKKTIETSLARTHPSYMPATAPSPIQEHADGPALRTLADHLAEIGDLHRGADREYADRLSMLLEKALAVPPLQRGEFLGQIKDLLDVANQADR